MSTPDSQTGTRTSRVNPVPDGYAKVAPYLAIRDAAKAIDFYKEAFGANERMRLAAPDGKVMHAEIEIEGGMIMLADEFPEWGMQSPKHFGGTPVILHVYVADIDAFFARAEKAGCTIVMAPKDQFYGDRAGRLSDPFGHVWSFGTHVEDVSREEMNRRFKEMFHGPA